MNDNPYSTPLPRANSSGLPRQAIIILRGIAGGVVGGVCGFFVFQWLARQGMYGMMIPGALIGMGAGLAARGRSVVLGVLCAIGAMGLSIYAEWAVRPFLVDKSLGFFVTHLHQLSAMTMIMMGLGAVFAYWLGQGR
jgi:hypothetical protein